MNKPESSVLPELHVNIPCPPCKAPTGEGDRERDLWLPPPCPTCGSANTQTCYKSSQRRCVDCKHIWPMLKQPDALARLEAWCDGGDNRHYAIYDGYSTDGVGITVELMFPNRESCYGVERDDFGKVAENPKRVAIAKSPGLAATIEAALEKAEEVRL